MKEELTHHGIKGQRWGIRRYQNADGTLTPAGKRRAQKLKTEFNELTGKKLKNRVPKAQIDPNKKSIKELTDTELKDRITRLRNEKEARGLQRDLSSNGQKFVRSVGNNVLAPAAMEAGRNLLSKWFYEQGSKALGMNKKDFSDGFDQLKKEANTAKFKYEKEKFTNLYNKEKNSKKNNSQSNNESTLIEKAINSSDLVPYKKKGKSWLDYVYNVDEFV